jgi:hypothetical protein
MYRFGQIFVKHFPNDEISPNPVALESALFIFETPTLPLAQLLLLLSFPKRLMV